MYLSLPTPRLKRKRPCIHYRFAKSIYHSNAKVKKYNFYQLTIKYGVLTNYFWGRGVLINVLTKDCVIKSKHVKQVLNSICAGTQFTTRLFLSPRKFVLYRVEHAKLLNFSTYPLTRKCTNNPIQFPAPATWEEAR